MDEWFDEQRNVLFFGRPRDLEALASLVSNCLKVLRQATRPREMVLETWLTADYAIRDFLLSGFELSRFCNEEFDLRYRLLPRDFSNLLKLLQSAVRFNADLDLQPDPPKPNDGINASLGFWSFIKDRSPELLERIVEEQRQYVLAKSLGMPPNADYVVAKNPGVPADAVYVASLEPEVTRMRLEWRRIACALDEEWFRSAKQLNEARNKAAHSFRTEDITRALGLAGPNVIALTQDRCLRIIQTLLGVRDGAAFEWP